MTENENTMMKQFVKERNEALFSLDRKKIEAYLIKYGQPELAEAPDKIFWAGVYKAICHITSAPQELAAAAKQWLSDHGME